MSNDQIGYTFGDRLRDLRLKENLTQEEFAEKLKINNRKISLLELGQNLPSFKTLVKLHIVFGFKIDPIIAEISEKIGPNAFEDEE